MIWVVWQSATVAGIFAGATAPPELNLDFAIPLTFMALIFPAITNRPKAAAALASGMAAIITYTLPYNLGLVIASAIGIATGFFLSERTS
ncbi:hypothetical protein [Desulfovibrio inopinatus]|uniref:hypothetical protein n=1 Tax=Desulfovibrio inopinatus TaxID=102109 RepID=UPI001B7F9241|nr:hypothetical protein [Desulfovibrio inopinatus]